MMRKLLITGLFFSFFNSSCSVIQSSSNKFKLNEIKLNRVEKKYNKLLIVTGGSAINHIFIDNLAEQLIQKLAKRKIKTSYSFLGSSEKEVRENFKEAISKIEHDAVLVITPAASAVVTETYDLFPGFSTNSTKAAQFFQLKLFDKTSSDTEVWAAYLSTNINFIKSKPYQKITDKIISRFKENLICK